MPLKLHPPRKGYTPFWRVRGSYLGVAVNRSTKTGKRALAAKILKAWERDIERGAYAEPSAETFASAAASYMKAGGERTYVTKLLQHFGEAPLRSVSQADIDAAAVALYPGATASTRNRQVHTPVSAILRHAGISLGLRRPKGSGGVRATAWLWPEQAEALLEEAKKLNVKFWALCVVLLYTGLRLSEALGLTWDRVRLKDGFAYIPTTKNEDPRSVFLPPVAVAALGNCEPRESGKLFGFAKGGHIYSVLRIAAFRAGVDLPARSAFHIFRHTYGTWMRRYAGLDTKGLTATGAWKDEKSASRYAHTIVSEEAMKAVLLPSAKLVQKKR